MSGSAYQVITEGDARLFQGDILPDWPRVNVLDQFIDISRLPILPPKGEPIDAADIPTLTLEVGVHSAAIILSQTCDLQPIPKSKDEGEKEYKIESVLFCPAFRFEEIRMVLPGGTLRQIRQHQAYGFSLLPKLPDRVFFNDDFLVADFRQLFALPIRLVSGQVASLDEAGRARLRLKPGPREHLSNALGQFFARPARDEDLF